MTDDLTKITYNYDVRSANGVIEITEKQVAGPSMSEMIVAWRLDTMEKLTRDALIAMGWTPPTEGMVDRG